MKELTNYGTLAYQKAEELENSLASVKHKVHLLEVLYGTTPPPPDPNNTEDTPYTPPPAGEIITRGDIATVPVYYSSNTTVAFPIFTSQHTQTAQ